MELEQNKDKALYHWLGTVDKRIKQYYWLGKKSQASRGIKLIKPLHDMQTDLARDSSWCGAYGTSAETGSCFYHTTIQPFSSQFRIRHQGF